jgi:hypothetical protein
MAQKTLIDHFSLRGREIMSNQPKLDYERLKRDMERLRENQKVEKLKAIIQAKIKQRERVTARFLLV